MLRKTVEDACAEEAEMAAASGGGGSSDNLAGGKECSTKDVGLGGQSLRRRELRLIQSREAILSPTVPVWLKALAL